MEPYDEWRNAVGYALDKAAAEYRQQHFTDEEFLRDATNAFKAPHQRMPPAPLDDLPGLQAAVWVYRDPTGMWSNDNIEVHHPSFIKMAREAWELSESGLPVVRF